MLEVFPLSVFTKKLFLVLAIMSGVLAVSACSSNDVFKKSDIEVRNAAQNDITNGAPMGDDPMSVANAASISSNGSVEIYDVDGSGMSASVASVQPDYIGIPSASDPRVIVYPVDGEAGAYPSPVPSAMGGYMPMNNASLSPSPSTMWDDEPMSVENGILSPRVGPNISSVYFGYGSAKLNAENKRAMTSIAETAKFAPVDRVSVEGYASRRAQTQDPIKAKILNLKESMNRAQTVSQSLIENGVPVEKIKTTAWGDTKPAGGGEAQNRRVDIVTGFGGQ